MAAAAAPRGAGRRTSRRIAAEVAQGRRSPFRPDRFLPFWLCVTARSLIAAAAVIVLLGAGGAAAAYFAFLQPEDEAPAPRATLEAPDPPAAADSDADAEAEAQARPLQVAPLRLLGGPPPLVQAAAPPSAARSCPVWKRKAPALLEFPPVISNGALFQLADNGQLASLRKKNGKTALEEEARPAGGLLAGAGRRPRLRDAARRRALRPRPDRGAAPAQRQAALVADAAEPQRVLAARARRAAVLRVRERDARTASTPAPARSSGPTAPRARSRAARRTRTASSTSATTAGACRPCGRQNGRRVWSSSGAGRFYATAAVAGRRVYIGSTAGRVYAFSTRNGKLRWSHQTGRYVYASAAISRVEGLGPDGLRRLLRRALLRAQRAHRPGPLDLQLGREDLRLGDGDRRASSTSPTSATGARSGWGRRPAACPSAAPRAPTTPSSPTASTST